MEDHKQLWPTQSRDLKLTRDLSQPIAERGSEEMTCKVLCVIRSWNDFLADQTKPSIPFPAIAAANGRSRRAMRGVL